MRLLLIVQDARFRTLIRHHVTCEWPDADVVDPLHPRRRCSCRRNSWRRATTWCCWTRTGWAGRAWPGCENLAARRGFAPVVFFAAQVERRCRAPRADTWRLQRAGEAAAATRHADFGADRGGARAPARAGRLARVARGRAVASLRRGAHSRLPLRAPPRRRIAVAAVPGRKREGRRDDGHQGHALRARRSRRGPVLRAIPAGIRDRPPPASSQHRALP